MSEIHVSFVECSFHFSYRKPKITELDEILCQFVDQLSEEKRQIFMSLSDCKVDENEEEKTELGIWRTNNFALGKNLS